jgi:hypothetical protein
MKRDEHKTKLNDLLKLVSPENQANASEILTGLSEDYEQILTESETAANRVSELTANNETLRSVNAKLFLKVGASDKETVHTETNKSQIESENKITFDKLFNDKGELL